MSLDFYLYAHCTACSGGGCTRGEHVFESNITHNLSRMWSEAGVYDALYNSEGKRARDILLVLMKGVAVMATDRARFEKLNASNGWGLYENALPWLRDVRDACEKWPDAIIHVSK